MFCLVNCAQRRAPSEFMVMLTAGLLYWSNSSFASVTTSPSNGALSVTFGRLDSIQFESLSFLIKFRSEKHPISDEGLSGVSALNFRHGKIFVDVGSILVISISNNRTLSAGINLQYSQQRMFFLDLCHRSADCASVFTFQCSGKTVGGAGSLLLQPEQFGAVNSICSAVVHLAKITRSVISCSCR